MSWRIWRDHLHRRQSADADRGDHAPDLYPARGVRLSIGGGSFRRHFVFRADHAVRHQRRSAVALQGSGAGMSAPRRNRAGDQPAVKWTLIGFTTALAALVLVAPLAIIFD